MKANLKELQFLSAWAREEKTGDPYALPAHKLQAANKVPGVSLIRAIKGWARSEGRPDEDIFDLFDVASPSWPWSSQQDMCERLAAIAEEVHV